MPPLANLVFDVQQATLTCQGVWTAATITRLQQQVAKLSLTHPLPLIKIDGHLVTEMDTAGAWFLVKLSQSLSTTSDAVALENFSPSHKALIDLLSQQTDSVNRVASPLHRIWLARLGERTVQGVIQMLMLFRFVGEVAHRCLHWIISPVRIQWKALFSIIENSGYQALPITGLLTFLIGIVLTYQMGLQLRDYGANIYIVNLVGLAILREFAPLMTAIIIAGRSGSAFTAQLGTMKVNEEIDALRTMGISPIERLVLPRLLGLILAMPLLTVWSDILGVIGGMVMSYHMLNIHYLDFILRFKDVIQLKTLLIGLLKAPVFAMIIAGVGCFQGFQVTGSAESVGQLTTRSVVQAIFLIVCADAFFSILLSWYGL